MNDLTLYQEFTISVKVYWSFVLPGDIRQESRVKGPRVDQLSVDLRVGRSPLFPCVMSHDVSFSRRGGVRQVEGLVSDTLLGSKKENITKKRWILRRPPTRRWSREGMFRIPQFVMTDKVPVIWKYRLDASIRVREVLSVTGICMFDMT